MRKLLAFGGGACTAIIAALLVIVVSTHRPIEAGQSIAIDDIARLDAIPTPEISSMHDLPMRQRESVDFLMSAPLLVRQAYVEGGALRGGSQAR